MNRLASGLGWYIMFLLSIVAHEAAHAFTAWRLGDRTAYEGGQVTLNPWPHVRREPVGTVLVPIVSYMVGGWMMGWASAPYDPQWARQFPRRAALMSFAGPAANLLIVLLSAALIRLGIAAGLFDTPHTLTFDHVVQSLRPGVLGAAAFLLSVAFSLNLLLFFFNLLPIPPLDGSGIYHLFSGTAGDRVNAVIRSPFVSYAGILLAWGLAYLLFPACHDVAIKLLYPWETYR